MKTKEQLKALLDQLNFYISNGSPLKAHHEKKYQETIMAFNSILARESK